MSTDSNNRNTNASGAPDAGGDTAAAGSPRKLNPRRALVVALIAVVIVALVGGIVAALVGVNRAGSDAGAGSASPTPSATATATSDTPAPSPATTPGQGGETDEQIETVTLPSECRALYDDEMWEGLSSTENFPLNDPGVTKELRFSEYEDVDRLLLADKNLLCTWGGPGDYGLITRVTEVTPERSALAIEALIAAGHSCGAQFGGTRCTVEHSIDGSGAGYSHVLRGNLWIATHWVNASPENYSGSIVEKLFS